MIHLEDRDGGATAGRQAEDFAGDFREVLFPPIGARMEEKHDEAGGGIDAGKVWAFVRIAELAGESQVFQSIAATVLAGCNVFDVKPKARG